MKTAAAELIGAILVVLALAPAGQPAEPSSFELVQTITLKGKRGALDHVALDPKRERLFLANKANNSFDIVDLKKGSLFKQVTNQEAIQGIAYAADLDKVYVGLGGKGLFNVFDGKTYRLLNTHKFEDDSDNVRYDPRTRLVYVAHAEKSLAVVDGKKYSVKADIKLPGDAEGFELAKGNSLLYVAIPSPCEVAVIDTQKNEVTANFAIKLADTATAIALDEAGHRILVGCRKQPMLVVLDMDSGKEVASVPIPGEVDDLFFDAGRKRIYASCGEGFIAVLRQVDADHYESVENIPTTKQAKTSLFVPETSRLYLAVPRQEGKPGPEIRIYQAK
jgi:DNA-binding beta-propeller fold protein YncE